MPKWFSGQWTSSLKPQTGTYRQQTVFVLSREQISRKARKNEIKKSQLIDAHMRWSSAGFFMRSTLFGSPGWETSFRDEFFKRVFFTCIDICVRRESWASVWFLPSGRVAKTVRTCNSFREATKRHETQSMLFLSHITSICLKSSSTLPNTQPCAPSNTQQHDFRYLFLVSFWSKLNVLITHLKMVCSSTSSGSSQLFLKMPTRFGTFSIIFSTFA